MDVPCWAIVREARRRAGMTQVELAERSGTSQAAVARYERARSVPSLDTLSRLVTACGLELRIHLEPLGHASDADQIHARLALTPTGRLRTNDRMTRVAADLRA